MTRRIVLAAGLAIVLLGATPAGAQYSLVQYPSSSTTFVRPYYVASPPGDTSRVFVVQGTGQIRLVKNGVLEPQPFLDISDDPAFVYGDERGLLSVAFPPDYASSGIFYIQYTRDSPVAEEDHYLVTEEFRRSAGDPDVADEATRRTVLSIPHLTHDSHNGGQLQFGPDGHLYISTGDGGFAGDPEGNAQDTALLLGKILRIDPRGDAPGEYSIPPGNPFAEAGDPGAEEIWSHGLRNPWRFSFDRLTGDLTIGDVGQATREEVDFASAASGRGAGVNFGWNCREGSIAYPAAPPSCSTSTEVFEPPALDYVNPPGAELDDLAAVIGGYVVRDGALPGLLGRYVFTDAYEGPFGWELQSVSLSDSGASEPAGLGVTAGYVASFGEDACAHLYVASNLGPVYRLEPSSGPFPCDPRGAGYRPPGVAGRTEEVNGRVRPAALRARARWRRGKQRRAPRRRR